MLDKLKALGLALIATLAIGAVGASGASAANDAFTSEAAITDLTGSSVAENHPTFTLGTPGSTQVLCEKSTLAGKIVEKSVKELTLHPSYDGPCEIKGFGKVTAVDTDGCDYAFTGITEVVGGETHATASEACTSGKEILFTTAAGINLHFAAQGPLLGVTYSKAEENKKNTITIKETVKEITYSCTGVFCGLLKNNGNGSNGVYTDDVMLTGYKDESNFVQNSTTHAWSGTEGSQVGLEIYPIPEFHSEVTNTTLIGEDSGSEEMTFNAGTLTCTEAIYKGTMSTTTQATVTIVPEFAGCEAFGFPSTEVLFNGCAYVLHRGASTESTEGSVDIECPAGKVIEVVAKTRGLLKCRVKIGAQNGLTTITETNGGTGSSRDITLDLALASVAYTQESGEGLGKCGAGSFKDGKIIGTPTMIGENEGKEQVGIWAE